VGFSPHNWSIFALEKLGFFSESGKKIQDMLRQLRSAEANDEGWSFLRLYTGSGFDRVGWD
jgi:hypothetical protein